MVLKPTDAYTHIYVYLIYTVCFLHVSAKLVAIPRQLSRRDILQIFLNQCTHILDGKFNMYGLKYTLQYINDFCDKFYVAVM
jgi:hypothetical protein